MDESVRQSVRFSMNTNGEEDVPRESFNHMSEVSKKSLIDESTAKKSLKATHKSIDIFNDPLYLKNGKRNQEIPLDLFVVRKQQMEREEKMRKKEVTTINSNDEKSFHDALKTLKRNRAKLSVKSNKYLARIKKARVDNSKRPVHTQAGGDSELNYCPLKCNGIRSTFDEKQESLEDENIPKSDSKLKLKTGKSKSTLDTVKSQIINEKLKPRPKPKRYVLKPKKVIKEKPVELSNEKKEGDDEKSDEQVETQVVKKARHPVIKLPPLKTRKWIPIPRILPEKKKIVIEYPPLKLRKTPWKPEEQKPKIKPKVKYQVDKMFNPCAISSLGKVWHSFKFISPTMQILRGNSSQYSKKFSFISNGKQSAFIAAVAISTLELFSMKSWTSNLLDEIISYGDINFRRQMKFFKYRDLIKPSEIRSKLYLKSAKVSIDIGESTIKERIFKEILNHVLELLTTFTGVIFFYHRQSYAIWREDNVYYIFNSEDTDEEGNLVRKSSGTCCVIRSTDLSCIIDYLVSILSDTIECYEIFSFNVKNKITIEEKMAKLIEKKEISKRKSSIRRTTIAEEILIESQYFDDEEQQPKSGLASILVSYQVEPTFGDNFQNSSFLNHNYLTCQEYLTISDKIRAPFIASVAIVMLRICKSSLWMSTTIEKIFQIGNALYVDNVESVLLQREADRNERMKAMIVAQKVDNEDNEEEDEEEGIEPTIEEIREKRRQRMKKQPIEFHPKQEIPITEVHPLIVEIGKLKFDINIENIIIGRVLSRNSCELSLKSGIDNLFKHHDYGLIVSHDVVAVWREQNRCFMFDPNQCDQYSRATNDDSIMFNSCLSCFKNSSDLVKLFIENLPKDQRHSTFKICKVETCDYIEKPNDWYNFKGIGKDKWILSGHISNASKEFKLLNRNHQSICMSLVALAKTREVGILSWSSNVIDEIVRIGDEFYSGCVMKLKEQKKFNDPKLTLSEIGRELKLDKIIVDFSFENNIIYGKLQQNGSTLIPLIDGLKIFFENDELAIVSACEVSLAVFKYHDAYYLFDSGSRDEMGRNFNTKDPINACKIGGVACLIRFLTLDELTYHMIANYEVNSSALYNISKIEISVRTSNEPCYFNYIQFESEKYGGILRAFNNYHEDSEKFKSEAVEKTLCNLLVCMCFTKVLNPRRWASYDINEILKIGMKFLCKIGDDFNDMWNILNVANVCSIDMKINEIEKRIGVFEARYSVLPNRNHSEEIIQDNTMIADYEKADDEELIDVIVTERSSIVTEKSHQESLKEILLSCDESHEFYAILSSSLFNIGIFKIDNFYYIFDPKASSDTGLLVKKRLEDFIMKNLMNERDLLRSKFNQRLSHEDEFEELIFGRPVTFGVVSIKPSQVRLNNEDQIPINVDEKGSAYVAWFTQLDSLHRHIMSKIPEKFKNQSFTMSLVDIQANIDSLELTPWNNFEAINKNHWILRGTISQNDSQFAQTHRNNQDAANCLIALTFANSCFNDEWNSTVIDVILSFGDRLHKKSLKSNAKISLNHLILPIFIRPFIVNADYELINKDYMIKSDDRRPLESLKKLINDLNEHAILISKEYHVAIWRDADNNFMMFDPHDIGPDGCKKSTGTACIQRFTNADDLIDIFFNNIKDIEGINEYQLIRVSLVVEETTDEMNESTEIPLLHHQNMKTIRAMTVRVKSNECVEMSICYAVAMLCSSQSLDAEFYTSDIIDRIIVFGNELANVCSSNDEACFKDFNVLEKSSWKDEIRWTFKLHDTFMNVQLKIFQCGVISDSSCPLPNLIFALEDFFNFHDVGLLIIAEFIVAIWKEKNQYFVFYSCDIDDDGKIIKCFGYPGVVILNSVHELYSNIFMNIQRENQPFQLRICEIESTDVCVKDSFIERCEEKKAFRRIVNEDFIIPAMSFHGRRLSKIKMVDEELESMIQKFKKNKNPKEFIEFSRGSFMCGKLSKNSKKFNQFSRKRHSGAICLTAAAMNCIKEMSKWSSDIIDCVVISGNSLYIESSIICKTTEIDITKLVTPIFIKNREIEAKVESCLEIAQDELKVEQMKEIFDELVSCYNACYIMRKWNCWAVVKNDKNFFLFDPIGIEVPRKKVSQTHATLYRFDSLDKLLKQLLICSGNSKEKYQIGGIFITLKPNEQKNKKNQPKYLSSVKNFKRFSEYRQKPVLVLSELPEKSSIDCQIPRNICL